MEITDEVIQNDIKIFEKRIQKAEEKLANLPRGFLPYQEHKKREFRRGTLENEIAHVKRLISIAQEALVEDHV